MTRQMLIVDDDDAIRQMLETHFTDRGFTCTIARDGIEALEILRRGQTQVLITDLDMPRMGGVALLRAVREKGLYTRSIVLTGYATVGNLTACLQEGAMALLPKPLPSLEQLDQTVDQAFDQMQRWIDQMTAIVRLRTPGEDSSTQKKITGERRRLPVH
ncbi:MAG TPA: response regulator [Planctomycetota bacterium]|jgi:DNA-binding NtrC family response regulator|nr:response regulator [Planctomycetota bacterium]